MHGRMPPPPPLPQLPQPVPMASRVRRYSFRFGHRAVHGLGIWADARHDNVIRLTIERSRLAGYMHRIVSKLPIAWQRFLVRFVPLWVLPDRIFLKTPKPNWDDEFANEKYIYNRLSRLQGHTIPVYYGEATYDGGEEIDDGVEKPTDDNFDNESSDGGNEEAMNHSCEQPTHDSDEETTSDRNGGSASDNDLDQASDSDGEPGSKSRPAIVLGDVGGVPLWDQKALVMSTAEIETLLEEAFRRITRLGFGYDDLKLDNFHLGEDKAGKRVVILDLESAWELASGNMGYERSMISSTNRLVSQWSLARDAYEAERDEELREKEYYLEKLRQFPTKLTGPSGPDLPLPLTPEYLRKMRRIKEYDRLE